MKSLFLLLALCAISSSFAQELNVMQEESSLVSVDFDYTAFPHANAKAVGLSVDYFLDEHWSIRYAGMLGQTSDGNLYIYSGLGQTAFYLGVTNFQADQLYVYVLLIALMLPESIMYSTPVGQRARVGLYLAPIGFDFEKDFDSNWEDYHISLEYGLKVPIAIAKNAFVTPQAGIKSFYRPLSMSPSVSLALQFKL